MKTNTLASAGEIKCDLELYPKKDALLGMIQKYWATAIADESANKYAWSDVAHWLNEISQALYSFEIYNCQEELMFLYQIASHRFNQST